MILFFFSLAYASEGMDFCRPLSEVECKKEKFCEPVHTRMGGKSYGNKTAMSVQFSHCVTKNKKKLKKFSIESH